MRKLLKKLEAAFAAAAFAEEGEVETARRLLAEPEQGKPTSPTSAEHPAPRGPSFPRPRLAKLP
jgi:hypothetical protein